MASRKEGTGSSATSSSSTTGAAGNGKGKGGSGDSAVKQVQIDGLVSGVPFLPAHVGSSVPSPVLPGVLSGSLPSGLAEAGPRFSPKTFFLYLHFLFGRRGHLLCRLIRELRTQKVDLGSGVCVTDSWGLVLRCLGRGYLENEFSGRQVGDGGVEKDIGLLEGESKLYCFPAGI